MFLQQICVALLATLTFSLVAAQVPPNPCPTFFSYVDDRGDIEGIIELPYDNSGRLDLKVNASMRGFFGKEKSNIKITLLTNPSDVLQGQIQSVAYRLTFPVQNSIPQITLIILNNRVYCTGPALPVLIGGNTSGAVTNMYATHSLFFKAVARSGQTVEGLGSNENGVVSNEATP